MTTLWQAARSKGSKQSEKQPSRPHGRSRDSCSSSPETGFPDPAPSPFPIYYPETQGDLLPADTH